MRDRKQITGKHRGAAQNECNFKFKLNPKNCNTSNLSQLQGLRWSPTDASDGKRAGRNEMYLEKNREIYFIFACKPEIHREREILAEQPRQAGKGD